MARGLDCKVARGWPMREVDELLSPGTGEMAQTFSHPREYTRVRARLTARIFNQERGEFTCPVRDLGFGGVFVEAADCLRADDTCKVEISLDSSTDGPKVEASGRVARVEPGRGLAITFTEMTLDSFDHLDRLVFFGASNRDEVHLELDAELGLKPKR